MYRFAVLVALGVLVLVPSAHAAVIVVDTTADGISGPLCDIRNAIGAADANVVQGGCTEVDPSGADVIDLTGLSGAIDLASGVLPTIHESVTLRGPGANLLAIDGGSLSQILIVVGGTLTIEGLTIRNGTAAGTGRGGCIAVSGAGLVLRDSRVTGCDAFNGGGIAVDGGSTAHIERSLVDANTAGNSGAGIIVDSSFLDVDDSTLSGNVAQQEGGGIATFGSATSRTRIASSTLADNGSPDGGNLYTDTGSAVSASLTHVLLADPRSGVDCAGKAVTSLGYNLATDGSCALVTTGDLTNTNADIDPALGDNGGPTPTHAVLPGSAAIDAGNPAGCLDTSGLPLVVDQRGPGFPRRTDGNLDNAFECDIGAFETAPEPAASLACATAAAALAATARVRRRR